MYIDVYSLDYFPLYMYFPIYIGKLLFSIVYIYICVCVCVCVYTNESLCYVHKLLKSTIL